MTFESSFILRKYGQEVWIGGFFGFAASEERTEDAQDAFKPGHRVERRNIGALWWSSHLSWHVKEQARMMRTIGNEGKAVGEARASRCGVGSRERKPRLIQRAKGDRRR